VFPQIGAQNRRRVQAGPTGGGTAGPARPPIPGSSQGVTGERADCVPPRKNNPCMGVAGQARAEGHHWAEGAPRAFERKDRRDAGSAETSRPPTSVYRGGRMRAAPIGSPKTPPGGRFASTRKGWMDPCPLSQRTHNTSQSLDAISPSGRGPKGERRGERVTSEARPGCEAASARPLGKGQHRSERPHFEAMLIVIWVARSWNRVRVIDEVVTHVQAGNRRGIVIVGPQPRGRARSRPRGRSTA
jgi:hypothetical protein